MPARLLAVIFLSFVVGSAAAVLLLKQAPGGPGGSGTALVGGPFSLLDGNGKRVTEKDFAGRKMLVFFGFTSCPEICPGGLQVISAALDKLGPKADKIAPIFITLDAERDTPAKVADYVKSFSPRLLGLSGSPEETKAAAKAYRVYFKKSPGSDANYNIDHTSLIYLMDETGTFVTYYPYPISVDDLASNLEKQL